MGREVAPKGERGRGPSFRVPPRGWLPAAERPLPRAAEPGLSGKKRSPESCCGRERRAGGSQRRTSVSGDGQRDLRRSGACGRRGPRLLALPVLGAAVGGHLGSRAVLRPDPEGPRTLRAQTLVEHGEAPSTPPGWGALQWGARLGPQRPLSHPIGLAVVLRVTFPSFAPRGTTDELIALLCNVWAPRLGVGVGGTFFTGAPRCWDAPGAGPARVKLDKGVSLFLFSFRWVTLWLKKRSNRPGRVTIYKPNWRHHPFVIQAKPRNNLLTVVTFRRQIHLRGCMCLRLSQPENRCQTFGWI